MSYEQSCLSISYQAGGDTLFRLDQLSLSDDQNLLGAYIKYRLKELKLPVAKVAELLGMSRAYVYQVQKGERRASDEFLSGLVAKTDMSAAELAVVRGVETLETIA